MLKRFRPVRHLLMLLVATVVANNVVAANVRQKIVVFTPEFSNPVQQAALLRDLGVIPVKPLRIVNGFAVSLPDAAFNALLDIDNQNILRIDDDIVLNGAAKPVDPLPQPAQELTWGVDRIEADLAWPETNGTMINVAVLDTGADLDHPDLTDNIKGNFSALNPHKSAEDDNGHGTHVSGIMAAANNTIGVIGAAPQINLYVVKVLGSDNTGNLSDILDGMQWCIDNHMQVVNMSFGATSTVQSLTDAVAAMHAAGIVQVAAAGNNGASGGTMLYPARYPETIAVSSVDINGNLAASSSYGPEIDLAAPGVGIYSTYLNAGYTSMNGTSMATPHVTASAALVLSVYPTLTPDEVKTKLKSSAEDLGLPLEEQGAGLVRPDFAIQ
ncbi:S8 family peptidase [Sulfurimonas sp. HSL-1656]|uniref:S8 family peptidase n=1 Tax=Thiomicrolovo subterrani TaxID=3131934 RepID=UPI0031F88D28